MRIISVFLALIVFDSFSQKAYREGNVYGFKQKGDVIIEPVFEYATDFSEGFACVKKDGKWGFIDSSNNWLVKPIYDKIGQFNRGFAKVAQGRKVGLINVTGDQVLQPIYDQINYTYQSWVEMVKDEKKGLYAPAFKDVPCEYSGVGMNSNGIAYGKKASGLYDIYDQEGLILENQEHAFSKWNVKENLAVAVKNGKYGLYNIALKDWVINPAYVHIEPLHTEEYSEYNEFGELTKYTFVYALFTEVGEVNYSIRKKTNGVNQLSILKAGSLNVLEDNVVNYEQTEEGKGYNRAYDYLLTFSDGKKKMLNASLKITTGFDWREDQKFREARVTKEDGMTSLYFNDELLLKAESIKPLTVVEEYEDKAGNMSTRESLLDVPYLVVKQSDNVALYDADRNEFVIDNLPSNTEFKFENGDELNAYKITYSADGKMGVLSNSFAPTKMIYQDVVDFEYNPFMLLKMNDEYHLVTKTNRDSILVSGDSIELFDMQNSLVFLAVKSGKISFYNPVTKNILGSYDEIYRKEDFPSAVITRKGDLYGLHQVIEEVVLEPQVKSKSNFVRRDVYPYYFYETDTSLKGIDGYDYECLDMHDVDFDENGKMAIGYYDCKDEGTFVPVTDARFKEGYSEVYPFFHMKGMNNRYGVVNHMGDTLIPFEYKQLYFADLNGDWSPYGYEYDQILEAHGKKGKGLISVRDGKLTPMAYSDIQIAYDFSYDTKAVWLYDKKRVGLYVHNKGVVYPAIYKTIYSGYDYLEWETDTLLLKTKKEKWGLGNMNGEIVLPTIYDDIRSFFFDYSLPYGWNPVMELELKKKLGIYLPRKNKMILQPIYDEIQEMTRIEDHVYDAEGELYAYVVTQKGKKGIVDYHGNILLPVAFEDFKIYPFDNYDPVRPTLVWAELDGTKYVNINDPRDSAKAIQYNDSVFYDKVVGYSAYKFNGNEIVRKNFLTGEETFHEGEIVIEGVEFDILYQNGKYGAIDKDGNTLVEPKYESGDFMPFRETEVMIGYENGVKYYIYVFNNERYTEEEW
ncbi:WG repeat-containing protein [Parvicella tangerina]|uniref:WG repeat-containing protein n=1 Tax=Parvicella tangerina TaxID=2829795 RepID=A0A916JQ12_9FLAO|nr:WG repeat-containing protein [Parvicella tangerina]CAG5086538.1 hypothetical protein CRYO30217_03165 [Parvicella tangerina]